MKFSRLHQLVHSGWFKAKKKPRKYTLNANWKNYILIRIILLTSSYTTWVSWHSLKLSRKKQQKFEHILWGDGIKVKITKSSPCCCIINRKLMINFEYNFSFEGFRKMFNSTLDMNIEKIHYLNSKVCLLLTSIIYT